MSGIFLYAEVLQNIRQITLYATLQTNKNEGTKVEISSDKRYITVHHDDQTAKLLLPLEVSGTAELTLPIEKAKDLSVRLALEDTDAVVPQSDENDPDALWSASSFNADGCLRCRQCDNQVTPPGATFVWKDLPSENWAEMMDFWHCHKPHDENEDNSTTEGTVAGAKGYGTNSRIRAIEGSVLIDSSTFLITKEDCPGAQLAKATLPNEHRQLQCSSCTALLGFEDGLTDAEGLRLYKWSLAVRQSASATWQSHEPQIFICAILRSLIDAQMVRKFVVHAGGHCGVENGLLLWVFNPDVQYTSSQRLSTTGIRAMKIFYLHVADPQKMLDELSTTVEELFLPAPILGRLEDTLRESTDLLPPAARKFQAWDVGLLDRHGS